MSSDLELRMLDDDLEYMALAVYCTMTSLMLDQVEHVRWKDLREDQREFYRNKAFEIRNYLIINACKDRSRPVV